MNCLKLILCMTVFLPCLLLISQKRVTEFTFDSHKNAINVSSAISVSPIRVKANTTDIIVQEPALVNDSDVSSLFFQFNAGYNVAANNINFAIAPKAGSNIRITHIEYRIRFGSVNLGNAGIFITKDPAFANMTQLWTAGNNKTFNTYKDFVIKITDSGVNYTESTTDSIRFVMAYGGTNNQGMYIDNFVIYGIVNGEQNIPQNISINVNNISKNLADRPSGANTCWLMDSDIKWPRTVSNESRFAEMKLGALRFPYGHLADNYIWHTPGQYSNLATTGPVPKVASPDRPSGWSWAVNSSNGTFVKDLSFDEYIAICKRQQIEPLIVVNAQSHLYEGTTVNYEQLKTSAAEWVRYANITKAYGVKYWQLGNEVEHDGNLTMAEYTNLFIDFATVMKAVDPTIKVGTGVLNNTTWNSDVLTKAGTLCDFVATHSYQHNSKLAPGGYRAWYKDNSTLIYSPENTQKMLDNNFPDRPEIEMHITETNVTGGEFPDMSNIDLYKALYWFEMNMNQLSLKNVKYTYCWGTHSPWNGENGKGDIGCILENSSANTIRPSGRVIQLINTYLKNKMVIVNRSTGFLRTYASVSNDGKELSVFILNKNLYAERANLNIFNYITTDAMIEKITFSGSHFGDTNPVISTVNLSSTPSQVELDPVSLTVLHYRIAGNTSVLSADEDRLKLLFDGENLHLSNALDDNAQLNIFTIAGRHVVKKTIEQTSSMVNLTGFMPGVYIANLQSGNKAKTIKIIK